MKSNVVEIYPEYLVKKSSDLMVRGKRFYAVWNEKKGRWSQDPDDIVNAIDQDLSLKTEEYQNSHPDISVVTKYLGAYTTGTWRTFNNYVELMNDNYVQLDTKITYQNSEVKKEDYVSKSLPYSITEGECSAYDELMSVLYAEDERRKIEWAIGSIIAGDSIKIQKFIVLYGEGGTGKSTVLNIIEKLFPGYYTIFDAKDLTSNSAAFSTEALKDNPLIGIQHDGDLSRIEDNTKLNSIVSHEEIVINEKHKNTYKMRMYPMLFLGTNSPVKITNAKSGLIRRLIDVSPTGNIIEYGRYTQLMSRIEYELGSIAYHCLEVYKNLGINYYGNYRSRNMILTTNEFFNFIVDNEEQLTEHGGVTMKNAYVLYKDYCDEAGLSYKMPRYRFASEIKNYFKNYEERAYVEGVQVRSWLSGFKTDMFSIKEREKEPENYFMKLDKVDSTFDYVYSFIPAAYVTSKGGPAIESWSKCITTLKDIDTTKEHFCKPPENLIVIDFDLKDEEGNKSAPLNLAEASKWPPTYAEFSKSGGGIHLHYLYEGDVKKLSRLVKPGVEIKIFTDGNALRRKLSKCNNLPIATINSGLPLKEVKDTVDDHAVKDELHLRRRIAYRLTKPNGISTSQSINLIKKDLDEAYMNEDFHYDLTDMKPDVLAFANNSTNHARECIQVYLKMHFKSEEVSAPIDYPKDSPLVIFDIEVKRNLLLLVWKIKGDFPFNVVFNPSPVYLEEFFKMKLMGFNNLKYDNPILYFASIGYTNQQLYEVSKGLISDKMRVPAESRNISYTDVFDFSIKKQSLKKWEVELGIPHDEMDTDWDAPSPREEWDLLAEYCKHDVAATEKVFEACQADFDARLILVKLCEIVGEKATPNDTTNQLTTKLITRGIKNPQNHYVYTDLSTIYPGYMFKDGRSLYKGIDPGEGGYVYENKGMYWNVTTFDVDSMHPHSILALNYFGDLTPNFKELVDLRMMVKSGKFDEARKMYDGALAPYLEDASQAKSLGNALKLAINSVYGLTAAHFPNALRLEKNVDNIVAKYGALFMMNLKDEVESRGYKVVHIKTDSIKIVDVDSYIIDFVNEYAAKYGFKFKIESRYERFCLVNKAVYIAKEVDEGWQPTGAQFAHPYVLKTLFTHEPLKFDDFTETKSVTSTMYLDFNEQLPEGEHSYFFVGKVGKFCPVKPGCGGGALVRRNNKGGFDSVTGTKGYLWKEADTVKGLNLDDEIDYSYFNKLVDDAVETISKFGDFEEFVRDNNEEEIKHA